MRGEKPRWLQEGSHCTTARDNACLGSLRAGASSTTPPQRGGWRENGATERPQSPLLLLLSLPTALRKPRGRAWRRSHGAPRRRPFKPEPGAAAADKMAAPGGAEAEGVGASPAAPLLAAEPPAAPGLTRGPHRGGMAAPPLGPAVSVVFPGAVSRESCCRFACELLKHVLYQRHQLPLPYEQLAYFCRRPSQVGDMIKKPPSVDLASKKCQQVLTDLEGMLQHLEVMFSLTLVPRVLILLGGSAVSPKELYELNLEGVCVGSTEKSLKTTSCVRKLFHSLFIADVFSELKALPAMGTVVMLQGHRDCGVEWFRPKLNYKVPTRGRKLTVNLSCDGDISISASAASSMTSAWEDYVWFQAPVTLKGFHE